MLQDQDSTTVLMTIYFMAVSCDIMLIMKKLQNLKDVVIQIRGSQETFAML
jgi:hypothetical protein